MFIDSSTTTINGKTYTRHLLRNSYRQDGKVKHDTIANLSQCSQAEITAMKLALKHKHNLADLGSVKESLSLEQGLSVGATWLVHELARQLGIVKALGPSHEGQLALWQIIARVLDQGSRLSAVRLAKSHAAADILNLEKGFTEDHLYDNLDWLYARQAQIEDRLFKTLYPDGPPQLFLYDVTSSYLEGAHNELAAFGYNRDGKKGKRQIVIGLLCDERGQPLSVEVFTGNTSDSATIATQIRTVAERFGGREVTFVGDRGMLKSKPVEDVQAHGFHYITAITKPQIKALLKTKVIQMGMFDQDLAEITTAAGVRYVLRRNPLRAQELQFGRQDKLRSLQTAVDERNAYLAAHPRAQVAVALREVTGRCTKLKLSHWVSLETQGREIHVATDKEALAQESKLDGCYVLKTDLPTSLTSKETVHERYKSLAEVEQAFRTCKTVHLEMRPIYVRLADHTRGHVLVVMLAYRIVQELAHRWRHLDLTVEEGLDELKTLCSETVLIEGVPRCQKIPRPRDSVAQLLEAAGVTMPEVLPTKEVIVDTRKKLTQRRKKR